MDYGRLTDHLGKNIDFTNVILIMTSNIGANEIIKEKWVFWVIFLETDNKMQSINFLVLNLEID